MPFNITKKMLILIGCSGWSYDDWVGGFYPIELANKKGAWFDYYAQYFKTVEVKQRRRTPPQAAGHSFKNELSL
jgi:hypothetical protein